MGQWGWAGSMRKKRINKTLVRVNAGIEKGQWGIGQGQWGHWSGSVGVLKRVNGGWSVNAVIEKDQ